MMKTKCKYDLLIVTNLPSFYKINLYNKISLTKKILVIFTGNSANIRNKDFFNGTPNFDNIKLNSKSTLIKCITIFKTIKSNYYSQIIIGGWDSIYMWLTAFISKKEKNALTIESSICESNTTGFKGLLKKIFIKRISCVYVSGISQKKLAENLNFDGVYKITKGVGIFNIIKQPPFQEKKLVKNFIYVGRLSPEKNLEFLIKTFNEFPELNLNIIGFGPLKTYLESIASSNIKFHGPVENKLLSSYYSSNDVFILPSISEPWGLVVEEALNNGIPVIVSDRVGCTDEIIHSDINGIVFSINDKNSLRNAIIKITKPDYYNKLRNNISQMDFNKIAEEQVNCYLQ